MPQIDGERRGSDRAVAGGMNYVGDFFGLPPLAPLARAAAALASDLTLPPLRPSETAAGFLRGMRFIPAFDVLGGERRHALEGQGGEFGGEALEGGEVASGEGGLTLVHEVAAGLSCGVHAQILHNDRTYVNRENTQ